jgi:uncharacterized protein YndB with AHSA1/START domain
MTGTSVIHETFSVERTYAAAPSVVFAAFCTEEAVKSWGDGGALKLDDGEGDRDVSEVDFRVGGQASFSTRWQGTTYRYEGRFCDIVPDSRILYIYETYVDGARISLSVATIEFADSEGGTRLVWTEQGVYVTGPANLKLGRRARQTTEIVNGLTAHLRRQAIA